MRHGTFARLAYPSYSVTMQLSDIADTVTVRLDGIVPTHPLLLAPEILDTNLKIRRSEWDWFGACRGTAPRLSRGEVFAAMIAGGVILSTDAPGTNTSNSHRPDVR